jgi:hypothetical protein
MKNLQLDLNKRLLIVETTAVELAASMLIGDFFPEYELDLICKGSELTEDVAYEIVDGFDLNYFVDYSHHNPRAYKLTALESFISAIEAAGYHWGKNPEGDQPHNTGLVNSYPTGHPLMDKSLEEAKKWLDAESLTFNPEKCIIFEIL